MRLLTLCVIASVTACGGSTTDTTSANDSGTKVEETGRNEPDTASTDVGGAVFDSVAPDGTHDAVDSAEAGSTDAAEAAVACSSLSLPAPVIVNVVAEAPLPLTGGAITDGTYVMTSATDYTGVGGATGTRPAFQRITRFSAGGTVFETIRKDKDAPAEAFSGTLSILDGVLRQTQTCPVEDKVFIGSNNYEATSTSFKIYVAGGGTSPRLVVMTKL